MKCRYGTHRVIEPKGVLPQAARKIDNTMTIAENEILIDVSTLNIDSASFTQLKSSCNGSKECMKESILKIVSERGKMQNPVTGSGGMLIGTVLEVGRGLDIELEAGDKIATLVSLSLTPLEIEEILDVKMDNDQVDIKGKAVLFETGIYAKIPADLPEKLVLAALDVAGAPKQTEKLVNEGDTVLILGAAGKSGVLCAYQAMKSGGKVIGLVRSKEQKELLNSLELCHEVIIEDATNAIAVHEKVKEVNGGELSDVTINVVNVPNTEMTSILATKDTGIVYFFSMATAFTKAALGAEGVGSDVKMLIGNGYTKGHAELTLDIIRESEKLRTLFSERYL